MAYNSRMVADRVVYPSLQPGCVKPWKGWIYLDPRKQFEKVGLPEPGALPPIHPGIGRGVNTSRLLEQIRAAKREEAIVGSFAEASRHPAQVGLAIWPGPPPWAAQRKEHQNVTIRDCQPGHLVHDPQPRPGKPKSKNQRLKKFE